MLIYGWFYLNELPKKLIDDISINEKYQVVLSDRIFEYADNNTKDIFKQYDKQIISLPKRFFPDKQFIEFHNNIVFLG